MYLIANKLDNPLDVTALRKSLKNVKCLHYQTLDIYAFTIKFYQISFSFRTKFGENNNYTFKKPPPIFKLAVSAFEFLEPLAQYSTCMPSTCSKDDLYVRFGHMCIFSKI